MRLVKTRWYLQGLQAVLKFIALDNPHAALSFERELQAKLELIKNQPLMCRSSNYLNHEAYRDLIHKGYTIIYKVEQDEIVLLDIFKWQNR